MRRSERSVDTGVQLAKYDKRRPLLFLRALEDDQTLLPESSRSFVSRALRFGRPQETIDALLLEEGSHIGPAAALGDPTQSAVGVYGAKRQYHDDDTWEDAVMTIMDDSRAIVCVLDHADGVWSEVEFLIRGGHHLKTLFIIQSRYNNRMLRGRLLQEFAARAGAAGVPTLAELSKLSGSKKSLVGFHFNSGGELLVHESSEFSWISVLLLLRVFLRSSAFQDK